MKTQPRKRLLLYPAIAMLGAGIIAANASTPNAEAENDAPINVLELEASDYVPHTVSLTNLSTLDELPEIVKPITVERVEVEKKTSVVEFEKKTSPNKIQCSTPQVTQKGVNGEKTETWERTFTNNVETSFEKVSEEITKQPVDEITSECQPAQSRNTGNTSSSSNAGSSGNAQSANISGTKHDWMRAAGIPESDWVYVDYIVSRESSWNPSAVNPSSQACSLAQALPCSKIKGNWRDPVVALKWQYNYVNQRYGGYAGAYAHSRSHGWY